MMDQKVSKRNCPSSSVEESPSSNVPLSGTLAFSKDVVATVATRLLRLPVMQSFLQVEWQFLAAVVLQASRIDYICSLRLASERVMWAIVWLQVAIAVTVMGRRMQGFSPFWEIVVGVIQVIKTFPSM